MKYSSEHQILALEVLQNLKANLPHQEISPFWTQMDTPSRQAFAKVLFQEAKQQVLQGEMSAIKAFELTKRIAPLYAKIQYKQAVFLFHFAVHKSSEKLLLLADQHVQHAIEMNRKFIDAWYVWGDILVQLGLVYKELSYFQSADEKYTKAFELCKNRPDLLKQFYWDWALCWYHLGSMSGEAVDIKRSIDKFEKTAELGCNEPSFWKDFALAWAKMGLLIRDPRFLEKASQLLDRSIQINPKYFSGWLSLARTCQHLYSFSRKEAYLARAHSAFSKAAEIKQDVFELWMHWGDLFLFSGQTKEEVKHLQMSAMKYAKALKLQAQDAEALSKWGEAMTLLGHLTGRLDQLKDGEAKILLALENARESACVWSRYGFCLYAQGQYFEDGDYYLHAIEKMRHALKINRRHFDALYGLGLAQFALGDLHQDKSMLKSACEYFHQAAGIKRNQSELFNHWGMTLMRMSDLLDSQELIEQAIDKYETAIRLYPESKTSTQLLYNYACALDFLGGFNDDGEAFEKAAIVFEQILKVDPDFAPVYYNLALVYSHIAELLNDVDYYNQSNDCFYRAASDDPEDELVWTSWGQMLLQYARMVYDPLKMDLYESLIIDAEKKLRQALSLGHTESLYHLASLYAFRGQMNEALQYLKLAHQKEAIPSFEQLMYDEYFESLRHSEPFQDFVENYYSKNNSSDN